MINKTEYTIEIHEGEAGLFYGTCRLIPGLLVAAANIEQLEAAIPRAISEINILQGRTVSVQKSGISLRFNVSEEEFYDGSERNIDEAAR